MITIRKAEDRGHARLDWLNTWYYTFSFADYHESFFTNQTPTKKEAPLVRGLLVKSAVTFSSRP